MRALVFSLLFPMSFGAYSLDAQCAAVLCLSPDFSGVPSSCLSIRKPYFAIKVFNPLFDPISTATLRHKWLRKCRQANSSDLLKIKKRYGSLPLDPGS